MMTRGQGIVMILFLMICACGSSTDTNQSMQRPATLSSAKEATHPTTAISRSAVVAARKNYQVEVVSFDASQEYGVELPYADMVRVRITNGSDIALPWLTLLTKRFDASGKMIGSSRKPAISVRDLKPGETAEVDFYPLGHLPGVKTITVEIEALIPPEVEQFFEELKGVTAG
jgi:hypothetical protein